MYSIYSAVRCESSLYDISMLAKEIYICHSACKTAVLEETNNMRSCIQLKWKWKQHDFSLTLVVTPFVSNFPQNTFYVLINFSSLLLTPPFISSKPNSILKKRDQLFKDKTFFGFPSQPFHKVFLRKIIADAFFMLHLEKHCLLPLFFREEK